MSGNYVIHVVRQDNGPTIQFDRKRSKSGIRGRRIGGPVRRRESWEAGPGGGSSSPSGNSGNPGGSMCRYRRLTAPGSGGIESRKYNRTMARAVIYPVLEHHPTHPAWLAPEGVQELRRIAGWLQEQQCKSGAAGNENQVVNAGVTAAQLAASPDIIGRGQY